MGQSRNIPREKSIERAILKFLNGLPRCYARSIHGSLFMTGFPDIMGCLDGRMLALEVKRPGGKPTPLQAAELDKWKLAGAVSGVVESVEDTRKLLENLGINTNP